VSAADIVERCERLVADLDFGSVREWKAQQPGRRAVGFLPVYVPREIPWAAGVLPVGILGADDQLEIVRGDACFQSYICHFPRSVIELGLSGRLDVLDGAIFPSTCDVIRNLSGIWKLSFPGKYARYFDVPQNFDPAVGGKFYRGLLRELVDDMRRLSGAPASDDDLRASIRTYNANRALVRELYDLRAAQPWRAPTSECYVLLRAGMLLAPDEHSQLVRQYLRAAREEERPVRDNARVVLSGVFCEQPPLDLIRVLERSGCYIVDDDFMLVNRWLGSEVPEQGDPIAALCEAYLASTDETASRFVRDEAVKGAQLVETVRARGAEGVIFAAPSFCDPALLERPMLQAALERAGIGYTAFKYAENTGQLQPIREQAGTFADTIKLWGAA